MKKIIIKILQFDYLINKIREMMIEILGEKFKDNFQKEKRKLDNVSNNENILIEKILKNKINLRAIENELLKIDLDINLPIIEFIIKFYENIIFIDMFIKRNYMKFDERKRDSLDNLISIFKELLKYLSDYDEIKVEIGDKINLENYVNFEIVNYNNAKVYKILYPAFKNKKNMIKGLVFAK